MLSVGDDPSVRIPSLDSGAYHERALRILAGERWPGGVPYQAPLYPYLLAALYAVFGPGSVGVLLAQSLLDAGTVVLVWALARLLFAAPAAWIAGAIAALYEVFFFFDALLLKVPLTLFLITAALWLLVRADLSGRARDWLVAGMALGVACLTRGNYLLFAPVAGLFAGFAGGRLQPARASAFAGGVLAALLPLTAHNYFVGGDLVLTTSQGGQNFYAGNHRGNDTGVYLPPAFVRTNPRYEQRDFAAEAFRRSGRELSPSEVSRFWLREGLAEIRADPGHFARHLLRKARLLASHHEIDDNQSYAYFVDHVSWMLRLPFPSYAALLPLGLLGMALGARQRAARLPIAFFWVYAASMLVFFGSSRIRIPLVPVLAVFAGLALWQGWLWARERRILPLLAAGAFLGVAYPFAFADVVETSHAITWRNLGVHYLGEAEAHRRRSLALESQGDAAGARAERGQSLAAMEQAEAHLRLARAELPGAPELRGPLEKLMLRIALEREAAGDDQAALSKAGEAVSLFPDSANAWFQLGRLNASHGDVQPARDALERALALAPRHRAARELLEQLQAPASTP